MAYYTFAGPIYRLRLPSRATCQAAPSCLQPFHSHLVNACRLRLGTKVAVSPTTQFSAHPAHPAKKILQYRTLHILFIYFRHLRMRGCVSSMMWLDVLMFLSTLNTHRVLIMFVSAARGEMLDADADADAACAVFNLRDMHTPKLYRVTPRRHRCCSLSLLALSHSAQRTAYPIPLCGVQLKLHLRSTISRL